MVVSRPSPINSLTSSAVAMWTKRPLANANFNSIVWAPELGLFCATSNTGTHLSTNGKVWTTGASLTTLGNICWSPELKVFLVTQFSSSSVLTSPDGITWTPRSLPTLSYSATCWSQELGFYACSTTFGCASSIDGSTWTSRTSSISGASSICWSSELGLFCAVGSNKAATSPDGITWTTRTISNYVWSSICWAPELGLFCAAANNQIVTSSDGITWTSRTTGYLWNSVCWAPELGLFCAVATGTSSGSFISTSRDGTTWTTITTPVKSMTDQIYTPQTICWSNTLGQFCNLVYGSGPAVGYSLTSKFVGGSQNGSWYYLHQTLG